MENTLNSRQKAILYANIIRFWQQDSDVYRAYREQIEAYMLDELIQRHLSEELAVITTDFLVEELLTIDLRKRWQTSCFCGSFSAGTEGSARFQVLYEQLQKRIVVPLQDARL